MNFITHGGVAINLDRISFIDFRKEGQATVHADGQSFLFDGADAAALLKRFPPAPAAKLAAIKGAKAEGEGEPEAEKAPKK